MRKYEEIELGFVFSVLGLVRNKLQMRANVRIPGAAGVPGAPAPNRTHDPWRRFDGGGGWAGKWYIESNDTHPSR